MYKISFSVLLLLICFKCALISYSTHDAKKIVVEEKGSSMRGWIANLAYVNSTARSAFVDPRDYWKTINQHEREAIRYIVLTLGNEQMYNLLRHQGELNKAGEKFKDVHPLNVWGEIFSSKDTTSALVNLRSKKLVWKPFMKGMADSLQEAKEGDNIKDEFIADFAKKVGIKSTAQLKTLLKNGDWADFVQYLIENAKKSSKDDRYNI